MKPWRIDILYDGEVIHTLEARTAELAECAAFSKMLRIQGRSVDYALKHGGYAFSKPYQEISRWPLPSNVTPLHRP